jgi:hypothetical protein
LTSSDESFPTDEALRVRYVDLRWSTWPQGHSSRSTPLLPG